MTIKPVIKGLWKVADFSSSDDYTVTVSDDELAELEAFNASMAAQGKGLDQVEAADFDCPKLREKLTAIYTQLKEGRGFVILSGFPIDRWSQADLERAYWGMGTTMGVGISQSVLGDRLGHVRDATIVENDPHARAYRSRRELNPHTDGADVVGLFCLRGAKSGGVSLFTNALSVHNKLLETRPDVLERLYDGFYFHRHGEQAPGEEEITPNAIPVFSLAEGEVSTTWNKLYMELGQMVKNDGPLTGTQQETFRVFLETANSDELQLRFTLEPGQIIWFNNLTHYHARTEFEDVDDPDLRRHLLRLWLRNPDLRPKSEVMKTYDGSMTTGIQRQAGKTPSFDTAAVYARYQKTG